MNITQEHPYIYINNIDLEKKASSSYVLYNSLISKANEDLITPPIFPEDIDGWLYDVLDRTKERILRNCIVYKITKDKKYLVSMKKQLWCLVSKWPWIEKFHKEEVHLFADLRTGIIMYTLGLVYDWMYEDLSENERKRLYRAITIKGFSMLKKDIKQDAMYLTSYGNNWLAVMLGGYCVAALATCNECDFSSEIIDLALERTNTMTAQLGDDGAWEEGPFYWGGISFLVMFYDIISNTDGMPNRLNAEGFKNTPLFPIYMNMPPAGRANFSDAHFNQDHNGIHILATMARLMKDPYYQWAYLEFKDISPINHESLSKIKIKDFRTQEETYQFLTFDETLEPLYPIDYSLIKLFQGDNYGFVTIRDNFGRSKDGIVLCANGGNNGTNHHQLDIGQVIVSAFGENLIFDPGYGYAYYLKDGTKAHQKNYFAKNTFGHNVVRVGNDNQKPGAKAKSTITLNNENSFTIDISDAYYNVEKASRKVIKSKNTITIIDEFTLFQPDSTSLRFFYNGELSFDENNLLIKGENCDCIGNVVFSNKERPVINADFYSEEGFVDRANNPLPPTIYNYIEFNSSKKLNHVFCTTFTFINKNL